MTKEEHRRRRCIRICGRLCVWGSLCVWRAPIRFGHDRVQEAAYLLIPEELRAEAHLQIGRGLLGHTTPERREGFVFEIVNQLNRGAALISSQDEREQLAELNLIAGKRAKASTAFASALKYLAAGASLLDHSASNLVGMTWSSLWNCRGPNVNSSLARRRRQMNV